MGAGSHTQSLTLAGNTFSRSATTSGDTDTIYGATGSLITLTAGKTVTGWTKTDADTATADLGAGHGLNNGTYDVYSSAGVCYRYGVTGTISGNTITLDGGTAPTGGAGFPASGTDGIVVSKQQQINVNLDGDNAVLVAIQATTCGAHLDFQDSGSSTVRQLTVQAGEVDGWDSGESVNPYTGNPITKVRCSNNSAVAGTLKIGVSVNSEVYVSLSSSPSASVSATPSSSVSGTPSTSPSSSQSSSVSATPSATPSSSASSSPSTSASSSPSAT